MISQSYLVYPEINSESIALVMDLESMEDNVLLEKPRYNDPLTMIYKSLDLQPAILSQITDFKNISGVPLMLEFFIFNLNENESKTALTYKLTRAFL